MTDFIPNPIVIKERDLFRVIQSGAHLIVEPKSSRVTDSGATFEICDIEANPRHFLRNVLPDLKKIGAVAVVLAKVDGKAAQIAINAKEYQIGADERARYDAWAEETSKEYREGRAFFDGVNEGGEGYNPYRQ